MSQDLGTDEFQPRRLLSSVEQSCCEISDEDLAQSRHGFDAASALEAPSGILHGNASAE